jgi:undecaprenyl-diphosphatase
LEVAQQFGDLLSIALVATLIWLLDPTRRRVLWLGAGSLACAGIIGTAAKNLVGRPRPKFADASFLGPWGTYDLGANGGVRHAWEFWRGHWADLTSMPSSHTLFAAALAAFLAFAYPRLRGLVVVLVVVVGVARVVLRSHYPSDVLVGGAVGWFAGTLGMLAVVRWMNRRVVAPDAV